MQRTIVLASVLSFVSAFLGGVLGFTLVVPTLADAQAAASRSAGYVLVASDGSERARLIEAGDGAVFALRQGEADRVTFAYGQRTPEAAAILVSDSAGTPRAMFRLASGRELGRVGDFNGMSLFDKNGTLRGQIGVDDSTGAVSIELLDADGNVTWSAP